jgi:hypothetical protein
MGTSASSKGPVGGVPMVPPWVPALDPPFEPAADPQNTEIDPDADPQHNPQADPQNQIAVAPPLAPPMPVLAPPARFGGARTSLGRFAKSGNSGDMRRGLRNYVRTGYGGSAGTARRFGGTAATANALYGTLSGSAAGQASESPLDPVLMAGRSAREIIDAVVEAVRPADGTQDAETQRSAIQGALSELLTLFPDADLLNLSEQQREFAIERFVALDVFGRFRLDVGKALQDKAPNAKAAVARFKDVRDYIKETVAAAFRTLRNAGKRINTARVNDFIRSALVESFQVFEAYIG